MTATPWEPEVTRGSALSKGEIHVLVTIERIGAGLSMVAIAAVVLSYFLFKRLRTTPNLFILFACTANLCASVASMIGYDGLKQGETSALCQAQGFIFQWFMQADPWWSFAMAFNVFLVFFYNINPSTFRKYAWLYCVICYGGPMITAIALISIQDDPRGPVFGDAVMWCWIGNNWSLVRIYSYYIPVWICIFLSIVIYVAVGYHVFHHRNQLRNLAFPSSEKGPTMGPGSTSDAGDSEEENLTRKADFYGTAVTDIQVTSDLPAQSSRASVLMAPPVVRTSPVTGHRQPGMLRYGQGGHDTGASLHGQNFEAACSSDHRPYPQRTMMTRLRGVKSSASIKLKRLDPVKMAYLRTSFIFGFAVLITWIPSSVNRLYTLTNNGKISFHLSVASGCVLPVQGVWNAIIYFMTSWSILREELKAALSKVTGKRSKSQRVTMRLESRLAVWNDGHRDTFERARLPNHKHLDTLQDSQDDIELRDDFQLHHV